MKKVAIILSFIVICAVALMQFSSCEKYVLPELYADKDTLFFNAAEGSQPVELTTNVMWEVESPESFPWVKYEPAHGEGSATIIFTAFANEDSTSRQITLTLKSEAIKKELLVIQEALK